MSPGSRQRAGDAASAAAGRQRDFGPYGGRFVPETLIPALDELTRQWELAKADASFQAELTEILRDYVGRPTSLYRARRLSERLSGEVYLKREDLNPGVGALQGSPGLL